jgi:tetratricopeptide (TPR) repeat protein
MQGLSFDPNRAVSIILGARVFPRSPGLELHGTRFLNSAIAFREYLEQNLGIPRQCVIDLFDDNRSPGEILNEISKTLTNIVDEKRRNNTPIQDLFLYYVGHGFLEGRDFSEFCLAIRATDTDELQLSTLDMKRLAGVIKSRARLQRRYLILDCCYSAAASRAWGQSDGPAKIAMRSTLSLFPNESPVQGTAILSAAESDKEANALGKRGFTTFSDALLQALKMGRSDLGDRFSLTSLHALILEYLKDNYQDSGTLARPKVESPEAAQGDVALFPVFPNAAHPMPIAVLPPPNPSTLNEQGVLAAEKQEDLEQQRGAAQESLAGTAPQQKTGKQAFARRRSEVRAAIFGVAPQAHLPSEVVTTALLAIDQNSSSSTTLIDNLHLKIGDVDEFVRELYRLSVIGHKIEQTNEEDKRKNLLATSRREADDAISREDWESAREKLKEVLASTPDDRVIANKLQAVNNSELTAPLYEEAQKYFQKRKWKQAVLTLEEVQAKGVLFREIENLIASGYNHWTWNKLLKLTLILWGPMVLLLAALWLRQ